MLIRSAVVGPFGVNCLILTDEALRRAVVIDPGADADLLLDALTGESLTLAAILHTHAHMDHVGGTGALARATGAPIHLHPEDQFLYDSATLQGRGFGLEVEQPPPVDVWLKEGVALDFGGELRLQVLHTPGHSPGSVTFALDQANGSVLVTGDTLFQGSIGRTDLPGGDMDTLMRSIREKLLTFPDEALVIPGHGPSTNVGTERKYNPFLSGRFA